MLSQSIRMQDIPEAHSDLLQAVNCYNNSQWITFPFVFAIIQSLPTLIPAQTRDLLWPRDSIICALRSVLCCSLTSLLGSLDYLVEEGLMEHREAVPLRSSRPNIHPPTNTLTNNILMSNPSQVLPVQLCPIQISDPQNHKQVKCSYFNPLRFELMSYVATGD